MPAALLRSRRTCAPALHLLASLAVAGAAAAVVFGMWYPAPFHAMAGGTRLFLLLLVVLVVSGPALTLVAAEPAKPRTVFLRDVAIVVAIQAAGFAYGISEMALARPVALVLEVDRLRLLSSADVDPDLLAAAPPELQELPWDGPRLLAAERPRDPDAALRSIEAAFAGIDIAMQPHTWRPFESQRAAAWAAARPVSDLVGEHPAARDAVEGMAQQAGLEPAALRFLPVLSRHASWVALLAPGAERIVGYLPYEGFF